MNDNLNTNKMIVYMGFNNMLKHKRGVENVIDFQYKAAFGKINYYLHWDVRTAVYRYKDFICISIKNDTSRFLALNYILRKIKKRDKCIFIHSHNTLMSIMSVYKTDLFTVHDALYYQNKAVGHRLSNFFYLLEILLYKRVAFVHFISDYAKKMSLFSNKNNFSIIYNTSHLEKYKYSGPVKSTKVPYRSSAIKVFVVRGIEERSRIDLILSIAEKLGHGQYEFLVAGKGPLFDFYNDQVAALQLKNIQFLGFVSDEQLISYYDACDLVLMPAEYGEGFGLPIIEGYLFNKPVIASNRCAIPEVIYSNEYLFENNVDSIIEKLKYAGKDLDDDYRLYYDTNFSNTLINNKLHNLYKSLIKC
ncbi:glycosyltransferase family 4 protein [Maribacter sp. CXY002]|uniref:glycosyltransferase family 4 protein n=1 Tax=Maribacter luteocoastalis TaxID=3407671 RepID=UPI003B66DAF4